MFYKKKSYIIKWKKNEIKVIDQHSIKFYAIDTKNTSFNENTIWNARAHNLKGAAERN